MNSTTRDGRTFRDLVVADLRGELDPRTAAALRSAECVLRWREELIALRQENEGRLAQRKAAIEEKKAQRGAWSPENRADLREQLAAYEAWKARAMGFLRLVINAEREAKRLQAQYNRERTQAERAERGAGWVDWNELRALQQRVERLEAAIAGAGS